MLHRNSNHSVKKSGAAAVGILTLVAGLAVIAPAEADTVKSTPESSITQGSISVEEPQSLDDAPQSQDVTPPADSITTLSETSTVADAPTANSPLSVTFKPGWNLTAGTWYYANSQGRVQTGWLKLGNTWYYLNADGAMKTGWADLGGARYYLYSSGAMATGWAFLGNNWFYFNSSGAMATGWVKVSNTWYYLNADGSMKKGWLQQGNTWFYLNSSGAMTTGSAWIDGRSNLFGSNGAWLGYGTKGDEILSYARAQVGKAYQDGAAGPNAFDCSGLTSYVYSRAGISIPRTTWGQIAQGKRVSSPQPGDIVVLDGGNHVGIYVSPGVMIDAGNYRVNVIQREIYSYPTAYVRFW